MWLAIQVRFGYQVLGQHLFDSNTQRVVKIGKLGSAQVRLEDPAATRIHAIIELSIQGASLVDMGTATGTQVNGRRVHEAQLQPGDQVGIGRTVLSIGLGADAATATAIASAGSPSGQPAPVPGSSVGVASQAAAAQAASAVNPAPLPSSPGYTPYPKAGTAPPFNPAPSNGTQFSSAGAAYPPQQLASPAMMPPAYAAQPATQSLQAPPLGPGFNLTPAPPYGQVDAFQGAGSGLPPNNLASAPGLDDGTRRQQLMMAIANLPADQLSSIEEFLSRLASRTGAPTREQPRGEPRPASSAPAPVDDDNIIAAMRQRQRRRILVFAGGALVAAILILYFARHSGDRAELFDIAPPNAGTSAPSSPAAAPPAKPDSEQPSAPQTSPAPSGPGAAPGAASTGGAAATPTPTPAAQPAAGLVRLTVERYDPMYDYLKLGNPRSLRQLAADVWGNSATSATLLRANPKALNANVTLGKDSIIAIPRIVEHKVQSGETLASIATRLLGDASLASLVQQANGEPIENPDELEAGTLLRAPFIYDAARERLLRLGEFVND